MSRQTQPIPVLESYFGKGSGPVIAQTFTPGKGGERSTTREAISRAETQTLKEQGITSIALEPGGRIVDFLVDELLRIDCRALLSEALIASPLRITQRRSELRRQARDEGRG